MINTIASQVADPAGYVELVVDNDQTAGEARRRVARIATLDGGVVVNDAGFSDGDRTIQLSWTPVSSAAEDTVERLVRNYTRLTLGTRFGVFLVSPENYSYKPEKSTLQLLAISKLSP